MLPEYASRRRGATQTRAPAPDGWCTLGFVSLGTIVALLVIGTLVLLVLRRSGSAPTLPATPQDRAALEHQLNQSIASGRKLEAIKAYRRLHGVGLKEAKEAVEQMSVGGRR